MKNEAKQNPTLAESFNRAPPPPAPSLEGSVFGGGTVSRLKRDDWLNGRTNEYAPLPPPEIPRKKNRQETKIST